MLATYNTTVQMLVPDWVKARSLALYQTAIFGGLAAGSFMGHFAGTLGVSGAGRRRRHLTVLLLYRSRLPEQVDAQSLTRADSAGPCKPPASTPSTARCWWRCNTRSRTTSCALIGAAHPLRLMRLRNGAQQWQLFRDLEREGCGARSSWSKAGCTCACWIA